MKDLHTKVLNGPVNFVYKKVDGEIHCTVVEFDLLGIGDSREVAFESAKELVLMYLEEMVKTEGPVRFYNWARDADLKDIEGWDEYRVIVSLNEDREKVPINQIRSLADNIQGIDLIAA